MKKRAAGLAKPEEDLTKKAESELGQEGVK